jgi:alpha-D-ribose 1-methylphosphonate 5-triphosphate synthase subunit PhnI
VKGGEQAIAGSHALLEEQRRGDVNVPELSLAQIKQQMRLAVDRVMTESSLYDPDLAALAIKQAAGDLIEAIFLVRAYRNTLPRLGYTLPLDTSRMQLSRRISAAFKDLPGGQLLGPTYDYTQRLLDFSLAEHRRARNLKVVEPKETSVANDAVPRILNLLDREDLIESATPDAEDPPPADITRQPLDFPASRAERLQNLVRADEGFLLAMGYSTQRGYAHGHPFAGEIRFGLVEIEIEPDELDVPISIGDVAVTECQMINQFAGSSAEPPKFTTGYGIAFGHCERKAMAMALVDRALRAEELGEAVESPAQMPEFVLSHSDNLEASGFVQHLKLPHYVDFQAELELLRRLRSEHKESTR